MIVLVDYDNVGKLERQRGLKSIVDRLFQKIGATAFSHGQLVQIRLYGGWYQGRRLSKRAQRLATEIGRDFPCPYDFGVGGAPKTVRVTVDLARSLMIDPGSELFNTYRIRGTPEGLRPAPLPYSGCHSPGTCPLIPLHSLLRKGVCPEAECSVALEDVVNRAEQKLVDTMLTTDLIHKAAPSQSIAVVSSDDDLWPGIRMALHLGATVHHVHPQPGRRTPVFYSRGVTSGYTEYNF